MNTSRYTDPIRELKKGIKCDWSLFPVLGRETGQDNFNQAFMIEAEAQDLYDVINLSYTSHNEVEKLLFFEKQSFMTAMLRRILETDKGNAIL